MDLFVSEHEVVNLLSAMVQADTVNPPAETSRCARLLKDLLDSEGILCELVEGWTGAVNLVATLKGGQPGRTLLLNGHIDTVPASEGWSSDQFSGDVRDGMLYGRGSCDMKSGVATTLMAIVSIKRSGLEFAGTIILQAVADEETGIPTVRFGPGNERLSHKPDECVAVKDLMTATRVYQEARGTALSPDITRRGRAI